MRLPWILRNMNIKSARNTWKFGFWTYTSDQDGIAGIRFILSCKFTKMWAYFIKQCFQDTIYQVGQEHGLWETETSKVSQGPSLLPCASFTAREQKRGPRWKAADSPSWGHRRRAWEACAARVLGDESRWESATEKVNPGHLQMVPSSNRLSAVAVGCVQRLSSRQKALGSDHAWGKAH